MKRNRSPSVSLLDQSLICLIKNLFPYHKIILQALTYDEVSHVLDIINSLEICSCNPLTVIDTNIYSSQLLYRFDLEIYRIQFY